MKILVMDDMKIRHTLFDFRLKRLLSGSEITHTYDADETIDALKKQKFDLAFFDYDLGYCDEDSGLAVAKWLTIYPLFLPLKIIIHSMNTKGAERLLKLLPNSVAIPEAWCHYEKLYKSIAGCTCMEKGKKVC